MMGKFRGNHVWLTSARSTAQPGLLTWGGQNIEVSDNQFDGGAGPDSVGISVRNAMGEFDVVSVNVSLTGNTFG